MFLVSAEANTSADAPCVSWVTRSDEPAKLKSTELPGLSVLNCSPISVNVAFRDAAAKTVIDSPDAVSDEPHPVSAATSIVANTTAPIRTRLTPNPRACETFVTRSFPHRFRTLATVQ